MKKYITAVSGGFGKLSARVKILLKEHPVLSILAGIGIACVSIYVINKIKSFINGGDYE